MTDHAGNLRALTLAMNDSIRPSSLHMMRDAADEIERLRCEYEELSRAVHFCDGLPEPDPWPWGHEQNLDRARRCSLAHDFISHAREQLNQDSYWSEDDVPLWGDE